MVVFPTLSIDWIFDIFSWEHLSAVATVFALLVSTAFIPIRQMLKKRKAEREKMEDEKETQKIKDISQEILKPIADKLNEHDFMVRNLTYSQKENDKNTIDTLSTVKSLVSEFHTYKDQQHKINAKLYFLDGAYQSVGQKKSMRSENNPNYRDWRDANKERDEENPDSEHL
jgi:uncharacterized membrane protein YhiD involved in acid resistance